MLKHLVLSGLAVFAFAAFPISAYGDDSENKSLTKTHAQIAENFSGITHLTPEQIIDKENVLFFDVREEKEFNVSHIKGATYVDPSIKAEAFMTEFEQDWTGKTIVFYCSVGQRSSLLAARVQTALKAKGASEVVNLEKGIFGWHNQSMPLTNENGQTQKVHPYNAFWKRKVNRKDLTSYKP